ncbi:kinase-like domain-containing protein [Rhizophagus clarus]|uniref:Kinase-like domain-containing protein n=1 Tax=Rhizophagus clarus TaxID=94130 RepID=A0A8H3LJH9_9GLOM|nr:kinase-like domain-containing protein [Rhizophagus clarus]
MGLCRPEDYGESESSIYGVLPYITPRSLRRQNYAKASDISGLTPYHIPQLIVNLIKRCLDIDPLKRSTAEEIKGIIWAWRIENNLKNQRSRKRTS